MRATFWAVAGAMLATALGQDSRRLLAGADEMLVSVITHPTSCSRYRVAVDTLRAAFSGPTIQLPASEEIIINDACSIAFPAIKKLYKYLRYKLPKSVNGFPGAKTLSFEWNYKITQQGSGETWGLDRLDQRDLPLTKSDISLKYTGKGVEIYLLDSGVNAAHSDVSGRVRNGTDFTGEGLQDDIGHGSRCAGLSIGSKYGVARDATLINVKVVGKRSASIMAVIKGLQHIIAKAKGKASVVNIPLSTSRASLALNRAVEEAAVSNLIIVIAAGNRGRDACKFSPSGVGGKAYNTGILSVGSTAPNDRRSRFSNYGSCVDMFAPGEGIASITHDNNNGKSLYSGTSASSSFASGVAAVYLEKHNMNRIEAVRDMIKQSTINKVGNRGRRSPNKMVSVASEVTVGDDSQSKRGDQYLIQEKNRKERERQEREERERKEQERERKEREKKERVEREKKEKEERERKEKERKEKEKEVDVRLKNWREKRQKEKNEREELQKKEQEQREKEKKDREVLQKKEQENRKKERKERLKKDRENKDPKVVTWSVPKEEATNWPDLEEFLKEQETSKKEREEKNEREKKEREVLQKKEEEKRKKEHEERLKKDRENKDPKAVTWSVPKEEATSWPDLEEFLKEQEKSRVKHEERLKNEREKKDLNDHLKKEQEKKDEVIAWIVP